MKRKDPTAWRRTDIGNAKYRTARDDAQNKANELRMDVGLEANDLFQSYTSFLLPSEANRSGHELRCEVVHPEIYTDTKGAKQ